MQIPSFLIFLNTIRSFYVLTVLPVVQLFVIMHFCIGLQCIMVFLSQYYANMYSSFQEVQYIITCSTCQSVVYELQQTMLHRDDYPQIQISTGAKLSCSCMKYSTLSTLRASLRENRIQKVQCHCHYYIMQTVNKYYDYLLTSISLKHE